MPLQVTNPSANVIEVFFQYTSEPKLVRFCLYSHFAYILEPYNYSEHVTYPSAVFTDNSNDVCYNTNLQFVTVSM